MVEVSNLEKRDIVGESRFSELTPDEANFLMAVLSTHGVMAGDDERYKDLAIRLYNELSDYLEMVFTVNVD